MSHHYLSQIFGAISDDGKFFIPLNNGYPIFTAKHVRTWPVTRVANPRMTTLEKEKIYMLTFNAHYNTGFYAIGVAFTRDFINWWEHPHNPLMIPTGNPLDYSFSGRIEGGVIVREDLERQIIGEKSKDTFVRIVINASLTMMVFIV